MKRRSVKKLEIEIKISKDKKNKAIAYYNLGLFHDNNNREKEAIPNYVAAIKLGLRADEKSKAMVWLASSLYKVGKRNQALKMCKRSLMIVKNKDLKIFLSGLEKRIKRKII